MGTMNFAITVIGTETLEKLLDRLLPIEGQDGEDVEHIERCVSDLNDAIEAIKEAVRRASIQIPPEEADDIEVESPAPRLWKPEEGETYYYFTFAESAPRTGKAVWRNGSADRIRARLGDVFESEASAWKFASGVQDNDR